METDFPFFRGDFEFSRVPWGDRARSLGGGFGLLRTLGGPIVSLGRTRRPIMTLGTIRRPFVTLGTTWGLLTPDSAFRMISGRPLPFLAGAPIPLNRRPAPFPDSLRERPWLRGGDDRSYERLLLRLGELLEKVC